MAKARLQRPSKAGQQRNTAKHTPAADLKSAISALVRKGCDAERLAWLLLAVREDAEALAEHVPAMRRIHKRHLKLAQLARRAELACYALDAYRKKLADLDGGLNEDVLLADLSAALPYFAQGLARLGPYLETPESDGWDAPLAEAVDMREMLLRHINRATGHPQFRLAAVLLTAATGRQDSAEGLRKLWARRQAERKRERAVLGAELVELRPKAKADIPKLDISDLVRFLES